MFKIVIVVAAVLAIVEGQPRSLQGVVRIGQLVQRVPTAVSHQSQTVVHNHANVVSDILAPVLGKAPAVTRVYEVPTLQRYQYLEQPYLYSIENK